MSSLSTRVSGHFGELLQGRMGTDGPLALISLPCPPLYVTAQGTLGRSLSIHTAGGRALISPARARQFLAQLGLHLPARVILRANMPLGAGAGVSTATLVALARLAGWRGDALTLARACVLAEGASDPLMLPAPERVLWASREGRVLAHLPALPAFDILGGFWGPPTPTNPQDLHFPDISALIPQWQAAAQSQNLDAIAQLATISARATLALRGPADDPTEALAQALGAKGFVIAHTGSARGLIFARGGLPQGARAALRSAGLRGIVQFGHRPEYGQDRKTKC
jgi:uncharacterized protein involved in propanediol utilization